MPVHRSRIGEILNAKWEDLDFSRRMLTLHDTKANERQFVPLNEEVISLLQSLPRVAGNLYIIAGKNDGKPLNFYRRAWLRVIKRAGIDYIPPHGLRHNWVSMMIAAGYPTDVVGHLVGHKSGQTTKKYLHHRPENLQRVVNTFADVIQLEERRKKANEG